jgi:GSH-dependent disulfide-bond oxidoreductase
VEDLRQAVLYGMRTGNCFRAAIALEEASIPFEARWYDPRNPREGEAAYRALNPTGKVPTLVIRDAGGADFVLSQSNAIVLFATEVAPWSLLPAEHPRARARFFERFFYFVTDVIAPSHAGFSLRSHDVDYAVDLLSDRVIAAIIASERFLSDGPFMAGCSFSIADIAAFTIVNALKNDLSLQTLPALTKWFAAVGARPAVQRGLQAFSPAS